MYFQVLESIPQIPIHVTEIKKLILKDHLTSEGANGSTSNSGSDSIHDLDEAKLLNVLTNGSTGRNPTFFKAYGHGNVFGLKSAIPDGGTTMEVSEFVPCTKDDNESQGPVEENVLYVQLPEGHPVITANNEDETVSAPKMVQPSLSFEEAVEQAEIIFDDGTLNILTRSDPEKSEETEEKCKPLVITPQNSEGKMELQVKQQNNTGSEIVDSCVKQDDNRHESTSIEVSVTESQQKQEIRPNDTVIANTDDNGGCNVNGAATSLEKMGEKVTNKSDVLKASSKHNLRPKRTLRHVQALKQQAKRRKRNTNIAASASSSSAGSSAGAIVGLQRSSSRKQSAFPSGESLVFA